MISGKGKEQFAAFAFYISISKNGERRTTSYHSYISSKAGNIILGVREVPGNKFWREKRKERKRSISKKKLPVKETRVKKEVSPFINVIVWLQKTEYRKQSATELTFWFLWLTTAPNSSWQTSSQEAAFCELAPQPPQRHHRENLSDSQNTAVSSVFST